MELSDKLQKVLSAVEELSVLELHQLVKALAELGSNSSKN